MAGLGYVGLPTGYAAEEQGELGAVTRRDTAGVIRYAKIDG